MSTPTTAPASVQPEQPRSASVMPEGSFVFPGTESVDRSQVFAGPGYTSPKGGENGLASTALWMSVGGLLVPVLLPVALVVGMVAFGRSRRLRGRVGRHEALAAIVVSAVVLVLWAVLLTLMNL